MLENKSIHIFNMFRSMQDLRKFIIVKLNQAFGVIQILCKNCFDHEINVC